MTSILVIGPTKFADTPQVESPSWVPSLLREDEPGKDPATPSPLGVRRAIARRLSSAGVRATVMEDHPQEGGEGRNAKFDRVVNEDQVDTYLTYWPFGGTLLGIAWELSHLTRRIQDEDDELEATDLPIYAETGVGSWDLETGRFTFQEEGNLMSEREPMTDIPGNTSWQRPSCTAA